MYEPRVLGDTIPASIGTLTDEAIAGRLTLCVGAGASIGDPCGLPSGKELAGLVRGRLMLKVALPECNPDDLLSVADAADSLPGGRDLLQREIRQSADFEGAQSNYAHQFLAELLLEGLIVVLSTNWDTCIERSAGLDQRIEVVISPSDSTEMPDALMLKVHGCASRPATLVVASGQLMEPPLWVKHAVRARFPATTLAFVGIGDIAPYMRKRLEELIAEVQPTKIWVVFPSVIKKWTETKWAEVIPGLPADRKVPQKAEEFLDELLSGYAIGFLADGQQLAGQRSAPTGAAFAALISSLKATDALSFVRWFRASTLRWPTRQAVLKSDQALRAAVAMSLICADKTVAWISASPVALALVDGQAIGLIISSPQTATRLTTEAQHRVREALSRGVRLPAQVTFLCIGNTDSFPDTTASDVMDTPNPESIIDGPRAWLPQTLSVNAILENAV